MRTIWKYPLQIEQVQKIRMPEGAQIICIHTQSNDPYLWAIVDDANERNERAIITCGTGHEIPPNAGDYIGTYRLNAGALIFHVFEGV